MHPLPTSSQAQALRMTRIGPLTVAVDQGATRIGFIHSAGKVFVALAGVRYDHSVEVAQSVVLERALQALIVLVEPIPAPAPATTHTARTPRRRSRSTRRSTGPVAA